MKKIVRLTESDMVRLISKVVKEQQRATGWKEEGEGGNTQRGMGWKEQGEGGTLPVMTMQQFLNDPNWGGRSNATGGDYWKVMPDFSNTSIIFGKGGKKIKVTL